MTIPLFSDRDHQLSTVTEVTVVYPNVYTTKLAIIDKQMALLCLSQFFNGLGDSFVTMLKLQMGTNVARPCYGVMFDTFVRYAL